MMFMRLSLAIVCVVSLAIFHVSLAQNSPQDYLNVHKVARASVGVGPMGWDAKVASYVRNYVNKLKGSCKLVHSGGPYGENLAWGSAEYLSGTTAVNMWVVEKPKYDYNPNSCVGGECRHYTLVVWRNSVRLGCAKVRCNNGGTIISCNYDPQATMSISVPI